MKNLLTLLFSLFAILLCSGFGGNQDHKISKTGHTKVEVFLDSIEPGPITKAQLAKVKIVRVTAGGGQNYHVKSYSIVLVQTKGGQGVIIKGIGNHIKDNLAEKFAIARPGDMVLVGDLVINGLDGYSPVKAPYWTIAD